MDERTFAAAVGDWLRATDTPLPDADANVHAAVARAGRTRQSARRHWAVSSLGTSVRIRRDEGRSLLLPLVAALALLLVIGSAAFALLLQEADRRLAEPIAASGPDGISWQTGRVELRAEAFRLEADGRTFTMIDTPLRIETDEDALSMVVSWSEDGSDLVVSVRFGYLAYDDEGGIPAWWLAEATAEIDGQVSRSAGPFLKTPVDETYRGDVELELGSGPGAVTLAFEDLSVAVQPPPEPPWWRGAAVLGIPIPDVVGDLVGPLLPEPDWSEPASQARHDPVMRASIPIGQVVLSGKLRGDGVFIITKNPGHRTEGVTDVAVGPGGIVWVAMRDGAVYRLGERDSVARASDAGPTELTRIEALADGSLLGYSGLAAWRLADGAWSPLPASGETGTERYDTVPEALERLGGSSPSDFVVGGITPDGIIWGHGVSSKRVQAILPDAQRPPGPVASSAVVDPALATVVGGLAVTGERLEQGVIRLTGADGRVIEGVKDVIIDGQGEVWVARHRDLFVPGRPERFGAEDGGPDWIDRLSLDPQGALVVSGDGYWRFRDGRWTDLSAPVRGLGTVDRQGKQKIGGYTVAGVDGDGRLWGIDGEGALAHWDDGGWVRGELSAIFPSRWPGDTQGTAYWPASIDPGSDVWVQLPQPRLAHFDGTTWSELHLDMAAVAGDPDAAVVRFLPTRGSTAWLLAATDGDGEREIDRVVRYTDGSSTPYSIDAIIEPLGLEAWQLTDIPRVARDGHSVIIPILRPDGQVDVVFDGATVTTVGPLPSDFTSTVLAPDGSVWGIGPDGTLLVLAASEAGG
jgi:hypothetical protein